MTKTTEKICKHNVNKVLSLLGGTLLLFGVILLAVKAVSPEYVDARGMLHEHFFLLPCGFLSIFCGMLSFLALGVRKLIRKKQ
ncbi:MAG: DUF3955 domain-containing protein [Clostridia bacterium]|nr:DUF3955 domain-containing protein [Clostridia bacterium]